MTIPPAGVQTPVWEFTAVLHVRRYTHVIHMILELPLTLAYFLGLIHKKKLELNNDFGKKNCT